MTMQQAHFSALKLAPSSEFSAAKGALVSNGFASNLIRDFKPHGFDSSASNTANRNFFRCPKDQQAESNSLQNK